MYELFQLGWVETLFLGQAGLELKIFFLGPGLG